MDTVWVTWDASLAVAESNRLSVDYDGVYVSIAEADITRDTIHLSLGPDGYGEREGPLEVKLLGEDNAGNDTEFTVFAGTASVGDTQIDFNIPELPRAVFDTLLAEWNPTDADPDSAVLDDGLKFRVLKDHYHTQYNFPHESTCEGGSDSEVYFVEDGGDWSGDGAFQINSVFLLQANLNGVGISSNDDLDTVVNEGVLTYQGSDNKAYADRPKYWEIGGLDPPPGQSIYSDVEIDNDGDTPVGWMEGEIVVKDVDDMDGDGSNWSDTDELLRVSEYPDRDPRIEPYWCDDFTYDCERGFGARTANAFRSETYSSLDVPNDSIGGCGDISSSLPEGVDLLGDSTVAVPATSEDGVVHQHLACGDQIFFETDSGTSFVKWVTDFCPGCTDDDGHPEPHLDNFTTSNECSGVPDLVSDTAPVSLIKICGEDEDC
jgi:hypothetical protein